MTGLKIIANSARRSVPATEVRFCMICRNGCSMLHPVFVTEYDLNFDNLGGYRATSIPSGVPHFFEAVPLPSAGLLSLDRHRLLLPRNCSYVFLPTRASSSLFLSVLTSRIYIFFPVSRLCLSPEPATVRQSLLPYVIGSQLSSCRPGYRLP